MKFSFDVTPFPEKIWETVNKEGITIEGYASMVSDLFKHTDKPSAILHSQFGIVSEIGELADAFKMAYYKELPLDLENVLEELGDILFYYVAFKNTGLCRITNEYLEEFQSIAVVSPLPVEPLLNQIVFDRINRLHQICIITKFTFLYTIAALAETYGFTFEQVILYNKYKLTGSRGRYKSGKFSVEHARERRDKNLQTLENNL